MEDKIVYEKIKEGDFVKVLKNSCGHGYKIGNIYEVQDISSLSSDGDHELVLDKEMGACFIRVNNVELIKNK